MEHPVKVNDILIVQAGTGTDQIGRFDIMVDTDLNAVDTYTWSTVPIDETHCPRDESLENFIMHYKDLTDKSTADWLPALPASWSILPEFRKLLLEAW